MLALPDGSLLAGGIGLLRRTPAADGWAPAPAPAAGARISGLMRAGATLLAAGVPGTRGLARSRDGGLTWEPAARPAAALPPMEGGALGQTAILQATGGDAYLLASRADTGAVMYPWLGVTRDGGETWTEVSLPLPDPDPAAPEPGTFITAYLAQPGGRLLVATDTLAPGPAVHTGWLRRAEGAAWQAVDLPARTFGFAAGPGSTLYAATENGVYRSGDGGGTWQRSLQGLPSPDVRQVPDQVYALTGAGPAWSGDGGRSWSPIPDSPPTPYLFPARPGILWLLGPGYGIRELALPATWPTAKAGSGVVDAAGHWTQLAAGLPLPTSLAVLSYDGQTWATPGWRRWTARPPPPWPRALTGACSARPTPAPRGK